MMSLAKKITIGVVSFLIVCIGLIAAIVLFYMSTSDYIIHSQLNAIKDGDISKAYSYTSKEFQSATSLSEFEEFVNHYPIFKNNKSAKLKDEKNSGEIANVTGTLRSKDNDSEEVDYRLIKEDGKWKILGISINQPKNENAEAKNKVAADSQNEMAFTKEYNNKDSRYSIKYPAIWEYDDSTKGTVIFSGKRNTPSYFSTVNIQTILTKKYGGEFTSVKQFIVDLKKQANELSTDVVYSANGPVTITQADGSKAQGEYLVFSYKYKGEEFKQWQVVLLRSDKQVFYAWAYTSPVEQYEKDVDVAGAMLKTWVIY